MEQIKIAADGTAELCGDGRVFLAAVKNEAARPLSGALSRPVSSPVVTPPSKYAEKSRESAVQPKIITSEKTSASAEKPIATA